MFTSRQRQWDGVQRAMREIGWCLSWEQSCVRYTERPMQGGRLSQTFAEHTRLRGNTAILGVGRDLCMLAVAAALYLNYHFMQVLIEINNLPSIIVFVQ
jgi:hypothetical protein